eukprot:TRINITY_DN27901_c0_g1_i3.p1 TRINITY_DN27901_c0_g1~~TRINITY_DN27901_c0_g1_i3.p1  ORF type:complete len:191 (-),score=35.19 TRINITY_DN27901_c0_g1_i3:32-604(-)
MSCGPPMDLQSVCARLAYDARSPDDVPLVRHCLELIGLAPANGTVEALTPEALGNSFHPPTLMAVCVHFDMSPREVELAVAPLFRLLAFLRAALPKEDVLSIVAHACDYFLRVAVDGAHAMDLKLAIADLCNLLYVADIFVEDKHHRVALWRHFAMVHINSTTVMPLLLKLDFKLRLSADVLSAHLRQLA